MGWIFENNARLLTVEACVLDNGQVQLDAVDPVLLGYSGSQECGFSWQIGYVALPVPDDHLLKPIRNWFSVAVVAQDGDVVHAHLRFDRDAFNVSESTDRDRLLVEKALRTGANLVVQIAFVETKLVAEFNLQVVRAGQQAAAE